MMERFNVINRAFRYTKRYREIITVFLKYGFNDFVSALKIDKQINGIKKFFLGKRFSPKREVSRYERLRLVLEELGPTFIKLGQVLSNRRDIMPEEFLQELEKLLDEVPPFDGEKAREIVEEELGTPWHEQFATFNTTAVASASIAQVHKATLHDGTVVAVKVRRPEIEKVIEVDTAIMYNIASLMERYIQGVDTLRPVNLVKDFKRQIEEELNFSLEFLNIQKFRKFYGHNETLAIPKAHQAYSRKRVLTMEYIEGTKASAVMKDKNTPFDKPLLAQQWTDLILEQIFVKGYFHADPHAGNILVLDDGRTCFLDFGMMGSIMPKQKDYLAMMILGIVDRDANRIARAILSMTKNNTNIDLDEFEQRIYSLIDHYIELPLAYLDISKVLSEIIDIVMGFRIQLPSYFVLMLKALITIEGIGRVLDPSFEIITAIEPFVKRFLSMRIDPKKVGQSAYRMLEDYNMLMRELPTDARDIIDLVKSGAIRLEVEPKGADPIVDRFDRMSYRIVFGMVLAALIMSSSVIVLAGISPKWNEIPIIGLGGFLLAGLMGFFLLVSTLFKMRKR